MSLCLVAQDVLAQLAAGCIDIGAARVADGRLDAYLIEGSDELSGTCIRCGLERRVFHIVELDDVDVCKVIAAEIAEGPEFLVAVVHTIDQGVLVGRPAPGLVHIFAHDLIEVYERVLLYTGHENIAGVLYRGVQGNGKGELLRLTGEFLDHGNDAAGRHGDMTSTDACAVGGVELAHRADDSIVVRERLALAHQDHTGDP